MPRCWKEVKVLVTKLLVTVLFYTGEGGLLGRNTLMCSLPSVLLRVHSCQQNCPAIRGAGLPSSEYRLLQLHFHWGSPGHKGSEHSVDEKHGSMEVGSGGTRRKTGIASRERPDTSFGLYSLDAHGPHEHKVPEHGACAEPTRWAGYTGCAIGGEERAVACACFQREGKQLCGETRDLQVSRELRRAHCPLTHAHKWASHL